MTRKRVPYLENMRPNPKDDGAADQEEKRERAKTSKAPNEAKETTS
jgi:hypothetical protein